MFWDFAPHFSIDKNEKKITFWTKIHNTFEYSGSRIFQIEKFYISDAKNESELCWGFVQFISNDEDLQTSYNRVFKHEMLLVTQAGYNNNFNKIIKNLHASVGREKISM